MTSEESKPRAAIGEVQALQAEIAALERDDPQHPDLKAKHEQLRLAYLALGVQEYGGPHAA